MQILSLVSILSVRAVDIVWFDFGGYCDSIGPMADVAWFGDGCSAYLDDDDVMRLVMWQNLRNDQKLMNTSHINIITDVYDDTLDLEQVEAVLHASSLKDFSLSFQNDVIIHWS